MVFEILYRCSRKLSIHLWRKNCQKCITKLERIVLQGEKGGIAIKEEGGVKVNSSSPPENIRSIVLLKDAD